MSKPLLVGITGGIGSGKSTVCRIFQQLGIPIYFADERGKHLLNNNSSLKQSVMHSFGEEAYLADGTVNRVYLADKVFSDEGELDKLNQLVHPAVAKDFQEWVEANAKSPIVIKEAALLIENESYKSLDGLITVIAPEGLRIDRVLLRDNHRTKVQVLGIIKNQIDDKVRGEVSNYLIDNSGTKLLIPQVLKVYKELLSLSAIHGGD